MPATAHPAFEKACNFLDVKAIQIPCESVYGLPCMKAYEKKINKNTIMLVGSAPNLAFGTVDPLDQIGELAGKYNTGFFLDGCMGSLLLPFLDDFGITTGQKYCDLRNKNVTGMSCDVHKYGMVPKGLSVLMFPKKEIKLSLHWCTPTWIGGLYATPNIQGSRPSHTIAAGWSVMVYHGYEEYARIAKKVFDATDLLVSEVKKIPELRIVGNPRLGNVTMTSADPKFNIHTLGGFLNDKGWFLNSGQKPNTVYCTIHEKNSDNIPLLVEELKDSLRLHKEGAKLKSDGLFKMYGTINSTPGCIIDRVAKEVIENTYNVNCIRENPTV